MKHAPVNHRTFLILTLVYMEHEGHFVLKLLKVILFLIMLDNFERFLFGSAVSEFCFSQEKIPDRIPEKFTHTQKKREHFVHCYLFSICVHVGPLKNTLDNREKSYFSVEAFKSTVLESVFCSVSALCALGVN